jgi:hypothetical protein
MGFNVSRWKRTGRDWSRGTPPPRGSIEYVGVGGPAFYRRPEDASRLPPTRKPRISSHERVRAAASGEIAADAPRTRSGAVYEITFTELDAAERWMAHLNDNVSYARKVHGKRIVSDADLREWTDFLARWKTWTRTGFLGMPTWEKGLLAMMSTEQRVQFDRLLNASKALHDRFVKSGMAMVPVPYMGELVSLLRSMPKHMTSGEMTAKLAAGVKCGEKMLQQNTAWWEWRRRDDTRDLVRAIDDAKNAAAIYGSSKAATEVYSLGSPAYDEFLRRLTKIFIEGAGLYGFVESQKTAAAHLADRLVTAPVNDKTKVKEDSNLLWLLVFAGVSYLGMRWYSTLAPKRVVLYVPDAGTRVPDESPHDEEKV